MSRDTTALKSVRGRRWVAFFARGAAAFWSPLMDPVAHESEDRDPVFTAERESFFWRAERQRPAW